jgi:RNA polymerase sigma factor (sigma-70 family)
MDRTGSRARAGEDATLHLVQAHAAELLRFARRFSLCPDDAHDAYQRSVEILVRRMRTAPPDDPLKWLRTVLRHEAYTVRRERERHVSREEVDFDRHESERSEDPSDRVVAAEQLGHVAEALRRLKPQEVTALVLRSEGLSYKEICARQGWTYTKTNRCVTEGRRALLDRLGAIESGAECARWTAHLSALADGEASLRQRAELRPHLRVCPACRATLRSFHEAPRQVAALVPVAALAPAVGGDPASLMGQLAAFAQSLAERATFAATRLQGTFDAVPGTKVAAVAASTAAIAGGGTVIERVADQPAQRPPAVERAADVPAATTALSPPPIVPAVAAAPTEARDHDGTAPAGEFGPEAGPASGSKAPTAPPIATTASSPPPRPPTASPPEPGAAEFAGF